RHARADPADSRTLRRRQRLSRARERSLWRLRTPDEPVVRVVGSRARRAARAAARGARRSGRARRRDSAGRCAAVRRAAGDAHRRGGDRKSTRLNSSHLGISYAVFCLKKKKKKQYTAAPPSLLQPPSPRTCFYIHSSSFNPSHTFSVLQRHPALSPQSVSDLG